MRAVRDMIAQMLSGLVGAVCGVLSVVGFAVAAVVPAFLGMLAFILSPLRMVLDRLRGVPGHG